MSKTKKIIFANLFYYLRGGAERVFFDEIDMLERDGHTVVPFARRYEENLPSPYSEFFPPPIKYLNVSWSEKMVAAFKLIYSFETKRSFLRLIEYLKPDIVHAHNIYGRLTTSIFDAAYKKEVPVVMTLHDYKVVCPSYLMLSKGSVCEACKNGKFYQAILRRCHKGQLMPSIVYSMETYINTLFKKYIKAVHYFICPSYFSLHKFVEMGLPGSQLIYIPNFVKAEKFEPKFSPGNYILVVGRLSQEKGLPTLLKAVRNIDVPVKIVGDGPMKSEYEAFIRNNNMNHVVFTGHKLGKELETLFKNASFLVFPSECYENAPMAILEAFAYGKPVIGSNLGGIAEMVSDQETGLLFKPKNHQDLREKIDYLLSRPSLITQMGIKARKKVEEEYSEKSHYHKLMKVYDRLT